MDTMRLKFLSEKRHHEELEEFQAASQHREPSLGTRLDNNYSYLILVRVSNPYIYIFFLPFLIVRFFILSTPLRA
jgi:hypothetical protein